MNKKLLAALAFVAMLGLASCGTQEDATVTPAEGEVVTPVEMEVTPVETEVVTPVEVEVAPVETEVVTPVEAEIVTPVETVETTTAE